jgi:hypothetical protein
MLNIQSENKQEPTEEFLYLVESKDADSNGNHLFEIAQYRKGKFWFFGWECPEPLEKFKSWKELIVSIKQ